MVKIVEEKARDFLDRNGLDTKEIPFIKFPPVNCTILSNLQDQVDESLQILGKEMCTVPEEYLIGSQLFLEGKTATVSTGGNNRAAEIEHVVTKGFYMKPVRKREIFNLVITPCNADQWKYERYGHALMVKEVCDLSDEDESLAFDYVDNSRGLSTNGFFINPRLHIITMVLAVRALLGEKRDCEYTRQYTLPFKDLYYRLDGTPEEIKEDLDRWRLVYPQFNNYGERGYINDSYIVAANKIFKRILLKPESLPFDHLVLPNDERDSLAKRMRAAAYSERQYILDDVWPIDAIESMEMRL
jgi:hypothetical protein